MLCLQGGYNTASWMPPASIDSQTSEAGPFPRIFPKGDRMAKITIAFSSILILLGLASYFGASAANPSVTALIPTAFGVALLGCGLAALRPSWRKHAMHAAVSISLLGALAASGRGLSSLAKLAADGDVNTAALAAILLMAVICWGLVAMCIASFIAARRRQAADSNGS